MPTESFFNFFDPPSPPQDDDDASSDIEERLELDYQLGEDIKEKLIPRAIDWFTGEALQFEQGFEDFDEDDFEDEDDEDEEDYDRDEEDDEEESDEDVSISFITTAKEQATNRFPRVTAQSPSRRLPSASRAR